MELTDCDGIRGDEGIHSSGEQIGRVHTPTGIGIVREQDKKECKSRKDDPEVDDRWGSGDSLQEQELPTILPRVTNTPSFVPRFNVHQDPRTH
jgi:hypothetical protein